MGDAHEPVASRVFTDPEQLLAVLGGWELQLLPSDGHAFRIEVDHLAVGDLRMVRHRTTVPIRVTGAAPRDEFAVAAALRPRRPMSWLGDVVHPDCAAIATPGAPADGVLAIGGETVGVSLRCGENDGRLGKAAARATPRTRLTPELHRQFSGTIAAAFEQARDMPQVANDDRFREGLTRDVSLLLERILGDGKSLRTSRRSSSRIAAVQRAEDLALERLATPLTIADLCRAAGLSERALRDAFHALRGASPMRYVRTLRLHAARRELLRATPQDGSVTEIALRCGFWHLGRFSVAYRRAFGEAPSVTLRSGG